MKVFWSYSRRDNNPPAERVSRFKNAFTDSLSQTIGADCETFFDTESIDWGVAWRKTIDEYIAICDGLIATLSPSFFNSRYCIYEIHVALQNSKRIYPVYFRTCKEFSSSFKEDGIDKDTNICLNQSSKKIKDFKIADFRNLRNKPIDQEEVQNFIDNLAEQVSKNVNQ
jgi:hypothetical protein